MFYASNHFDHDAPDYVIVKNDDILIVEHFDIDCYKSDRHGSKFRQEKGRIDRSVNNIPATLEGKPYHYVVEGEPSFENYILNLNTSFSNHYLKINNYKQNIVNEGFTNDFAKIKTLFLINDSSPVGTVTIDDSGNLQPVISLLCSEFLDLFSKSDNLDYVLSTSMINSEKLIYFADRNNLLNYYKECIDYRQFRFLNAKPHTIGFKIAIPTPEDLKER